MSVAEYRHLYSDTEGESHCQNRQVELISTTYEPPAPALDVSPIAPAVGCGFARLAAGWVGDWHPSPTRQWIFFLAGAIAFEASTGEVYYAKASSAILLEDTTGKGHCSRVIGDEAAVVVIVQL